MKTPWPMTRVTTTLTPLLAFWSSISVGWKTPSFLRKDLMIWFLVSVSGLYFLVFSHQNCFTTQFPGKGNGPSPRVLPPPPLPHYHQISETICFLSGFSVSHPPSCGLTLSWVGFAPELAQAPWSPRASHLVAGISRKAGAYQLRERRKL